MFVSACDSPETRTPAAVPGAPSAPPDPCAECMDGACSNSIPDDCAGSCEDVPVADDRCPTAPEDCTGLREDAPYSGERYPTVPHDCTGSCEDAPVSCEGRPTAPDDCAGSCGDAPEGGSGSGRQRALRRVFSRIGFAVCAYMLATMAVQMLAALSPAFLKWVNGSDWGLYLYSSIPQYLVGAPLLVLLLRPLPRENWPRAGMTASGWMRCLLMCFGLGFAGNLIGQMVQQLFTLLTGLSPTNPLESLLDGALLPQIVCIGIAAPVVEELLFRKLLIDRLHRFGDRTALFVSALVFGLLHGNFSQLFYAFGIGLLLGYLYCRTRQLGYTILLHMAVNLFSGVLLPLLIEALGEVAAGMLSFALIALYVCGIVLFASGVKRASFAPGTEPPSRRDGRLIFGNPGMICYLVLCAGMCVYALFPA